MHLRRFRLKFRRNIRKRKQQAVDISSVADESFEKYLIKRIARLLQIKRFLFGWLTLMIIISLAGVMQIKALSSHYKIMAPANGGIFREGVVGSFSNANPLFAQNSFDVSVSKLIFGSLFKYDENGQLKADMAENYQVDDTGTLYTVKLKKGIKWHDGQNFNANDVMFTYQAIKNPATKSYLEPSWRGVTLVKKDDFTIQFKLDNALSSFPNSLTNGIVPSHILKKIDFEQLRSIKFNNEQPVGTGPFKFETINFDKSKTEEKSTSIVMDPYVNYHLGSPKLEKYVIKSYSNPSDLEDAYKNELIDVASGLNDVSKKLAEENQIYNIPLSSEVMIFFKNNQEILKDPLVRQALTLAINKPEVLAIFNQPVVQINEPLLPRQVGYNKQYAQGTNNPNQANKILDDLGWKKSSNGDIRQKDGKQLKINLVGSDNPDFSKIMLNIQSQWRKIGVQADIQMMPDQDLQNNVSSHNYDALLYGISIGEDPDVYAYWHSSQSDIRSSSRLNLSEYKSTAADKALEAGRTRSEASLRAIKYKPFLEAWQKDYPAIALYQQQYLVISNDSFNVYGEVHGTGTLIGERLVLTCAHVISVTKNIGNG